MTKISSPNWRHTLQEALKFPRTFFWTLQKFFAKMSKYVPLVTFAFLSAINVSLICYGDSFCLLFAVGRHFNRKVGGLIQYTTRWESHLFFSSVSITCHCERLNILSRVRILILRLLRVFLWTFFWNLITSIFLFVVWWRLRLYSVFLHLLLEHFIHVLCQLANFKELFRGNLSAAVVRDMSAKFQRPV